MNEVTTIEERPGALQIASPPSETQALIAVLQQAVANPDIDIDRMERLVKLAISTSKELDADRAKKAYAAAMAQFKRNPPKIVKDAHVRYETDRGVTEYDHSTLGALCEAVIAGLAAVGIYHDWKLSQIDKAIQVTCVLTHEMGHKEEFPSIPAFPDGSGGKNAIQANQSTVTYLQRSTLFSATGLAALAPPDRDGRDTDVEGMPRFVTDEQAAEIRDRLKAIHADTPKSLANFLAWIKADAIEHIAAKKYQVALDRINQKGKELNAGSAK